MDNAQKAIMVGVGLFITIIIIAAAMLIVSIGQNTVDKGTSQIAGLSAQLEKTIIQKYDQKTLTGAEVKAAIQQYWTSSELSMVVFDNGKFGFVGAKKPAITTVGNDVSLANELKDFDNSTNKKTPLQAFTDPISSEGVYIPSASTYKSTLIKMEGTNTVVGVLFRKSAD